MNTVLTTRLISDFQELEFEKSGNAYNVFLMQDNEPIYIGSIYFNYTSYYEQHNEYVTLNSSNLKQIAEFMDSLNEQVASKRNSIYFI